MGWSHLRGNVQEVRKRTMQAETSAGARTLRQENIHRMFKGDIQY